VNLDNPKKSWIDSDLQRHFPQNVTSASIDSSVYLMRLRKNTSL